MTHKKIGFHAAFQFVPKMVFHDGQKNVDKQTI